MIDRERFRQARNKAGLTQVELAAEAGVSQQLITQIETGLVRSTKAIYRIAAALFVSAHYLDTEIPAFDDELMDTMAQIKALPPEHEKFVRSTVKDALELVRTLPPKKK